METGLCAKRLAFIFLAGLILRPEDVPRNTCYRPAPGSAVQEPEDLRSQNGELTVDLRFTTMLRPMDQFAIVTPPRTANCHPICG